MASAKYLIDENKEIEAKELLIQSLPKLPIESDLEKSLPKALRQLSFENYSKENTGKCSKELIMLIDPLLTNTSGEFVFMKDEVERTRVKEALELFVKVKAFKMLKEYHVTMNQILKMNIFWIRDISTWEWNNLNLF